MANYITQPLPRRTTPAVDAGRDRLARQEEPDIDQLVPRVERAMWAYTICKGRFDAVRETLGMYLQKDTAPSTAEPAAHRRPSRDGAARDGDGDIPF